MSTHVLSVNNVSKAFGEKKILDNVSLELFEGEIVSLLGVSGSGKTTLFNAISGLNPPDSGEIILNGENITGQTGRVSYMLQKDLLLPYYTVLDNVCLPLIIKKKQKKAEAREFASSFFAQFGLEGTQKYYPTQLSGGMKQRAAFLRTYLSSDGVALLDEPFSSLDAITKTSMHRWYLDIMREIRLSTIFITHDIDEAILLSDRIYILSGRPGMIRSEISIDCPRPRKSDFALTEEFLRYKRDIIEKMGL